MTPEEALALAKSVADLYADATAELLRIIGRATAKGLDRPDWAEKQLAQILPLRRNAQQVVSRMQASTSAEIRRLLAEVYDAQANPGGTSLLNNRTVVALAADTINRTNALGPRVLRATEDIYRQIIEETLAAGVTGVQTRRQATARALDRFAQAGIGGFTDSAGRRWSLEAYGEMATRTALGRAHLAGTLQLYADQGHTHVVISNSPEECPECREFEGKVLSLGADVPPPDLGGLVYAGTLQGAIAKGLFHPNCTHRANAFIPGLTRPMGVTENPTGYADRQRQRALERRVRESKRRVAALKPLGDTPELRRQKALLGSRRTAMDDFNSTAGRKKHVSQQRTSVRPGPLVPDLPTYDETRRLLGLARQVHELPAGLPTLPVQLVPSSAPGQRASYRYGGTRSQAAAGRYSVSVSIDINTAFPGPKALSVVHEFGHFLDHRGLGVDRDRFASVADVTGALKGVDRAISNSLARFELTHMRQTATGSLATHLSYLVKREELFARAYAQWIAIETQDPALLAMLADELTSGVPSQWDTGDFEPIRDAFRNLFEGLGLRRWKK